MCTMASQNWVSQSSTPLIILRCNSKCDIKGRGFDENASLNRIIGGVGSRIAAERRRKPLLAGCIVNMLNNVHISTRVILPHFVPGRLHKRRRFRCSWKLSKLLPAFGGRGFSGELCRMHRHVYSLPDGQIAVSNVQRSVVGSFPCILVYGKGAMFWKCIMFLHFDVF